VDKAVTSVILNVAEGNGRYLDGDRRRFLECNAELEPAQRQGGADLLGRIALMTAVMSRG